MADYVRKPQLMLKRGMNVTLPGDRLGPEWFQLAKNVRSYRIGEWRQRPGMILVATIPGNEGVYHFTRINDNVNATFRRVVATFQGKVYFDNAAHNAFALVDSGYGTPGYSSVISRPDRSPLPYLFLGNDARQSKFSTTGTRTEWGLAAPVGPPVAELFGVFSQFIDLCDSTAGFSVTNGVLSLQTRVGAVAISHILYDAGTTGFCSVVPATMSENFQEGQIIVFSGGPESVPIEDVFQPIVSTTIADINYDSGSTGPCVIQLTTPTTGLRRDSLVRINSAENVRVISVTEGVDGIPSFRCSTVGTFSAGQTVAGLRSFRAFTNNNHTTAETLSSSYVQNAVTGAGLATIRKTAAFDLSQAGARPIQPEDYIHIGLNIANFSLVSEIQLQFDCDLTTNDFTQNYFFKSIRPPDLQAAYAQTASSLTAQQQEIQRTQIDDFTRQQLEAEKAQIESQLEFTFPDLAFGDNLRARLDQINSELGTGFVIGAGQGTLSDPGVGGAQQWTELKIPVSSFQRVGSDETRGWSNIAAFQISINATGAVNIGLDDLWIGGTFGPSVLDGLPGYTYVYRARNTTTGSRSNPSPPLRSPILPKRDAVIVTVPSGYPDSQADVFDVFRIGGTMGEYHFVGSAPASSRVLLDVIADDVALRNIIIEVDRFKPWAKPDLPKTGTCNVIGTTLIRTAGDLLNVATVRGTQIIINDKIYSFYTNPSSTSRVELNESGGDLNAVTFQIPEPLLDGQPLPAVFGPYAGAGGEFTFAVGDTTNPGFVYFTNGNDPESSSDENLIELCGPGEKLMNGVVLDGVVFCFSDKRSWRILPSFQGGQTGGGNVFYPQETAMGKGLAGRWGICVGDAIYFVAYDGIYRSRGDAIECITDDSIAPIFRHDGTDTDEDYFGLQLERIDFNPVFENVLSLTYSFEGLYFTYKALNTGFVYCLFYSFFTQGWVLNTVLGGFGIPEDQLRVLREIRSQDADNVLLGTGQGSIFIQNAGQNSDNGQIIDCRLWDREEIFDDIRASKIFGDLMVDLNPDGETIGLTAHFDNDLSQEILTSIGADIVRSQYVRNINAGFGNLRRGIALEFGWSGDVGAPRIYGWEPAALIKVEKINNRAMDWDNGGYGGTKWLQGFRLRCDTLGGPKTFAVDIDSGTLVETFTVTAFGELVATFSLTNPVVCHEMRIRGTGSTEWFLYDVEWIFEPEPEQALVWETQVTSFDLPFFMHIREMMIAHRSTSDVNMAIETDGGVVTNYPLGHSSGVRERSYTPVKSIKSKYFKFRFTSGEPFGLWIADIECRVGPWGRADAYTIQRPFGDISRTNGGARV